MSTNYIAKDVKEEIIRTIKAEGITAAEAGRRYGINVKNIYRWLSQGIGGGNSELLQLNKLKRENEQLKKIIGGLILEGDRGKKG